VRKTLITSVLVMMLTAAASASAAATREEYAAQADPYCQAEGKDNSRHLKRFIQADKHGRYHAAGNALNAIGQRISQTNGQLRLLSPPPGDETVIAQWLGDWDVIAHKWVLSASAYRLGEYRRAQHLINTTGGIAKKAGALVAAFPFQYCA
jgi:hypothetical protein